MSTLVTSLGAALPEVTTKRDRFRGTLQPRIMHVVLTMCAGGGAETLVYDMVRRQALHAAYPPVVCCLHILGGLGERLRNEGFRVYCHPKQEGLDLASIKWLAKIMKEEGIGVIHAHQYTPMFYSVAAALLAGKIKVIYTEHGRLYPDRRKWKRYLFNSLLAQGVDHIVAISESTRKAMIHTDNFPARKVRVVHNGIHYHDAETMIDRGKKRKTLGLDEKSPVIGTAARLEEIKNIPMMLQAFSRIVKALPETRLVIAGSGSREKELKAHSAFLGIGDKVVFLGLRHDLQEVYRICDLFLLSSFTEGISLTLLEAMSCRLPVVVTAVGGNPEVVVEGVTGHLVPLGDDRAMAERSIELLSDQVLRQRLGENGRERVRRHFSFEQMLSTYNMLYFS